jgi:undecaprenyl-diphosphatase
MTILNAVILGIIQGITEFLPVSSSGHLVLAEKYLNLDTAALKSFDVAAHAGTLLAILIYFHKDIIKLIVSAWRAVTFKKEHTEEGKKNRKLLGYLIAASVPAVILGVFFEDYLDSKFRNASSVAIMLIVVGVLFFVAEYISKRIKKVELGFMNTFLIGIAQACALIPGVSRSGATITTGLVTGVKRDEAARFSFLLGAVAITGATMITAYKVYKGVETIPSMDILITGIFASFVAGLATISFLMKYLKSNTLHVFGIYRVILGFALLYLL